MAVAGVRRGRWVGVENAPRCPTHGKRGCAVRGWVWCVAGLVFVGLGFRAQAYTPESEKVQRICERAVQFLEKTPANDMYAGQLGGQCLVALAIHKFYKHKFDNPYENKMHPMVRAALQRCRREAPNLANLGSNATYSIGIALIFLSEVSPGDDFGTIQTYVAALRSLQKGNGGWGYTNQGTGDISQTQYGVLGLWSATNVGVNAGREPMERLARFLVRVQDPSGGWGYQANDPGPGATKRVSQPEVSHSLTAAGLSSLYVASDYLGFSKATPGDDKEDFEVEYIDLPPVFIPVVEDGPNAKKKKKRKRVRYRSKMAFSPIRAALEDGNAWMQKRFTYSVEGWQYYYIYALERYFSFREFLNGKFETEPQWYNGGVDFLASRQASSGQFQGGGEENCGPYVDTAFGVLFLLRSTRDTIQRVTKNSGQYRGNYGLPDDVSEVRLTSDFKVKAPKVTVAMDDIMQLLEGSDEETSEKFDDIISNPDAYAIGEMDPKKSRDFTLRMRRVLRSGTWRARILAARLLGRQGDLDNVPILIYALTDPDPRVVKEAWLGLRLTRRELFGGGRPPDPKDPASVEEEVARWKKWYLGIRPDAAFIEPEGALVTGGRQKGAAPPEKKK